MDIQELIKAYKSQRKYAARLFNLYQELKAKATDPPSAGNYTEIRTKSSGGRDNLYAKMATTWQKWQAAQIDYIEMRQDLFDIIMKVENPDEADILYLHIVDGMKHPEIVKQWPADHRGEILTEPAEIHKYMRGLEHLETMARKL